jgi:2-polyprenyl-6-methoxyphenol hydroxylase-like FAD-dependent oxidoreductase
MVLHRPIETGNFDAAGHRIGEASAAGHKGPPAVFIYRPLLADVLRGHAQQLSANLRFNISVQALKQDEDGEIATFTDGTTNRYDLVIGADGLHSTVRRMIWGDEVRPIYAGQTSVRWMAAGPPIDGPTMMYRAPGLYVLSAPLPKQNLIYGATVSNRDPTEHVGDDRARDILAAQLACFTAPYVVELAKRLTAASEVIVRPFEWLLTPDPWFRERVLLIGDAAHATTAQMAAGGGMAMEDALVLAACMANSASAQTGLEAFMKRRFERVRLVVEAGVTICKYEHDGAAPKVIDTYRQEVFKKLAAPY